MQRSDTSTECARDGSAAHRERRARRRHSDASPVRVSAERDAVVVVWSCGISGVRCSRLESVRQQLDGDARRLDADLHRWPHSKGENVVAAANVDRGESPSAADARVRGARRASGSRGNWSRRRPRSRRAPAPASRPRARTASPRCATEGLSTQLELTESRVLLQQARANRAQAARDFQVARLRLTLLKDLPLGSEWLGIRLGNERRQHAHGAGRRRRHWSDAAATAATDTAAGGTTAASVSGPGQ